MEEIRTDQERPGIKTREAEDRTRRVAVKGRIDC